MVTFFGVPVELVLTSRSDVSIEINNRFEETGINIPFPQQYVNIFQQAQDSFPAEE